MVSEQPDVARLEAVVESLRAALTVLDATGLPVAAAHLDGVIQQVEAESVRLRNVKRGR